VPGDRVGWSRIEDCVMAKRKRAAARTTDQGTHPDALKRPTIVGTDLALTMPTPQGRTLDLSYWDLWFALVAVAMHEGDLDRLAKRIKEERGIYYDRDSIERKRCHLRDLERRLEGASITPAEVVDAAGDLAKAEKRRALKKVMDPLHREREFSEPMRDTPRQRRIGRAMRGYWDRFPVSPRPYYESIRAHFQSKSFYSESMSYRIARTLDRHAEQAGKLLEAGEAARAQALLRAWMTVIVELMERADDSGGSIAMSFDEGFRAYLKIPLEQTGIDESIFFPDLLDFLIWEDYGLTDEGIEGYFRALDDRQADLCVEHLRHEVAALRDDDLEYQSEQALTLLGQVIAEQDRFDEFEEIARQMGSRAWRRIIRLADRAMKKRKRPLAMKVLEAAMTKGDHRGFLKEKYEKLKRGHWSPDPRK
jgi:hypothetical protein